MRLLSLSRLARRPSLWALVVVLAGAVPAEAGFLLQVGGTNDVAVQINPGQAAAVTFSLANPAANVTITADLVSPLLTSGTVFLTTDFGPTAGPGSVVASGVYNGTSTTLFTGLNLAADSYILIVAADTTSNPILWRAGTMPTEVLAPGVTHTLDLFAQNASIFPPSSNFTGVLSSSAFFTVEEVEPVAGVPEPATWVLFAVGAAGLTVWNRRLAARSAGDRVL